MVGDGLDDAPALAHTGGWQRGPVPISSWTPPTQSSWVRSWARDRSDHPVPSGRRFLITNLVIAGGAPRLRSLLPTCLWPDWGPRCRTDVTASQQQEEPGNSSERILVGSHHIRGSPGSSTFSERRTTRRRLRRRRSRVASPSGGGDCGGHRSDHGGHQDRSDVGQVPAC